jgi:hypothetical protein
MARLSITLSDERHRALKQAAARRGITIGRLIEQSLEFCGIKTDQEAADLVRIARARAGMTEEEAIAQAVAETREHRDG